MPRDLCKMDCFAEPVIGARSRDPVARNPGVAADSVASALATAPLVRRSDPASCRAELVLMPVFQQPIANAQSAFSRHELPEFCVNLVALSPRRGRRENRVRAAPAVSCAKCTKESAHEHTGSAETLRPSLRSGFTAYFVLSPVTGFLATVAPAILTLQNLAPAPGRQDHTTSPSAINCVRLAQLPRPPHLTARW